MPSPVRATHAEKHGDLLAWLRVYSASTAGVTVLDNATVRLDRDNEPQPDVLMRIESAAIGQSQLDGDDYVTGAPELVVEVVASSAAYDLHDKLHAYGRNGVRSTWSGEVYDRYVRLVRAEPTTSTGLCRRTRTVFCTAGRFPGCGWRRIRFSMATSPPC